MLFFETEKPCKQKTVLLEEWFSSKTPKWDCQLLQSPLFYQSSYSNSHIKGQIKPFLSSFTFIFDHILSCAFFIILILVGIDQKENQFGNNLEWFHSLDMKIHKIYKKNPKIY